MGYLNQFIYGGNTLNCEYVLSKLATIVDDKQKELAAFDHSFEICGLVEGKRETYAFLFFYPAVLLKSYMLPNVSTVVHTAMH